MYVTCDIFFGVCKASLPTDKGPGATKYVFTRVLLLSASCRVGLLAATAAGWCVKSVLYVFVREIRRVRGGSYVNECACQTTVFERHVQFSTLACGHLLCFVGVRFACRVCALVYSLPFPTFSLALRSLSPTFFSCWYSTTGTFNNNDALEAAEVRCVTWLYTCSWSF